MIRLALLLGVVAGGGQCADSTAERAQACGAEGCPADLECVFETCVGAGGPAYPIALRVVPRTDTTLAPVELGELRLTQGVSALDTPIVLPELVPVSGQVLGPDDRSQPVRRIVVEPIGGIPARPLVAAGVPNAINPTLFSFALTPYWPTPAGVEAPLGYRVRATFRDLPPWQDTLDWIPGDPLVVIRVLSTDDMPTISGEVRALGLPIRAVRVVALDEATGRQLSSAADTDAQGRFAVRLWPTGAAQSVVLSFSSADPARPLPTHFEPVTAPPSGQATPVLVDLPFAEQSRRATIRVLQPVGEDRIPMTDVDVTMRRTIGTGAHVIRGRTDATGTFSALAFAGEYIVDLRPPATTASRISRVVLTLGDGPVDALLRPRTAISGRIVDVEGRPVADASIEARLVEAAWADEALTVAGETPPSRRFGVRSAADGQFLVNLDPGRHQLVITPPEGSGMPPFATTLEFQGDQPRTDVVIVLPPAASLGGAVIDAAEAPVVDAAVDVWVLSDPPLRIARARTGADGQFRVRLPVRLQ